MKKTITLEVNGVAETAEVEVGQTLLRFLRDGLDLTGTKEGCNEGECGSCMVLLDGRPVNSCLVLAVEAEGRSVTTVEGLSKEGLLHPLQKAFLSQAAVQCGFCMPGMVMTAKGLVDASPEPAPEEVAKALQFSMCRCTGYVKIEKGILDAARLLREGEAIPDEHAVALSVGAKVLRADAREKVVEGCNARELDSQTLTAVSGIAERPELVVADLSFISLVLVFPAIARTAPTAQLLLLVKPQFEVGRQGVRDGIVIDMETAVAAAIRVLRAAVAAGFACAGIAASPITGEHGNRELLAHFVPAHPGANVPDPTEWEQHIRELLGGEA